jgi:DNA-binding protein YbaB
MVRDIDEAWIDEAVERYRVIQARQAEFDEAIATMEVTVRSGDDTVEVVVTAAGTITEVRLLSPLHSCTNAGLSRAVQEAVSAAADAARWARQKLHADLFGDYRPLRDA